MKKRIALIASIVLVLAIAVSGTLAYFTSEEKAENIITTGSIDISVDEWADEDKTEAFPEEGVENAMPGDAVTKIVEVTNDGTGDAWIRVSVEKVIELAEGTEGEPDLDLIILDVDTENWTLQDGYYYYNEALAAGETAPALFTTVTLDTTMGNMYQNCTININVQAQAVQAANNGETALEAEGWPEE